MDQLMANNISRTFFLAFLGVAAGCSAGVKGDEGVKNAATQAQAIAQKSFTEFKILSELAVPPGEKTSSIIVELVEGTCYRIIAVRAPGSAPEDIKISFKHSEQVVETGSDFLELSASDGEKRKQRVVWGLCVWPSLVGKLEVFNNLSATGGYVLILSAPAEKLGWKGGRDVRLYLKGTGKVDLKEMEKKEVEPALKDILSKDHMNIAPPLQGKKPIFHDIVSANETAWQVAFRAEPMTCYHLLLASPNCILKYKIVEKNGDKTLYDDGAPPEVGRNGWIHDFCLDAKAGGTDSLLQVKMKMTSDEYEHFWFAVALYGYETTAKAAKKIKLKTSGQRRKAESKVKKCDTERGKCDKGCVKKKGKEKTEDPACKFACLNTFGECTKTIQFEGELPFSTAP
jgi:hypothetical protein